jgi:hypothetical protein
MTRRVCLGPHFVGWTGAQVRRTVRAVGSRGTKEQIYPPQRVKPPSSSALPNSGVAWPGLYGVNFSSPHPPTGGQFRISGSPKPALIHQEHAACALRAFRRRCSSAIIARAQQKARSAGMNDRTVRECRAAYPQKTISAGDGDADRRRKQHRHSLFLVLVPSCDLSFQRRTCASDARRLAASFSAAALIFHLAAVEAHAGCGVLSSERRWRPFRVQTGRPANGT